MKTSLLTSSKLMTGSLILLLVSVFSINAYSYLLSQGEITGRLAEAEKLKQEQAERNVRAHVFPDRAMDYYECSYYIILDLKYGEIWVAESEAEKDAIIDNAEAGAVLVEYGNDGHKVKCTDSGNGCTLSTCGR